MSQPPRGFTLIELLIAVGVIAILAAIAYPSYADYILRGRLVDATNALSASRATMEQFYQDNRTYVGGPCTTSLAVRDFTVACAAPTATTYLVTATGSGVTDHFVFSIDQDGTRRTTSLPAPWGSPPANGFPCWITKRGETC